MRCEGLEQALTERADLRSIHRAEARLQVPGEFARVHLGDVIAGGLRGLFRRHVAEQVARHARKVVKERHGLPPVPVRGPLMLRGGARAPSVGREAARVIDSMRGGGPPMVEGVHAREVLDSRGNPTVAVAVATRYGAVEEALLARAKRPSCRRVRRRALTRRSNCATATRNAMAAKVCSKR